ncbi:hypothetical protein D3C75_907100 [compost metagenome]
MRSRIFGLWVRLSWLRLTSDTFSISSVVLSLSTLHVLSSPYCVEESHHQAGFSLPRLPPKSPGLVHMPISTPLIHTDMSDGQLLS